MDINYLDGTRHDTGTKTAKLLFTNNKSMSFFYKTNYHFKSNLNSKKHWNHKLALTCLKINNK